MWRQPADCLRRPLPGLSSYGCRAWPRGWVMSASRPISRLAPAAIVAAAIVIAATGLSASRAVALSVAPTGWPEAGQPGSTIVASRPKPAALSLRRGRPGASPGAINRPPGRWWRTQRSAIAHDCTSVVTVHERQPTSSLWPLGARRRRRARREGRWPSSYHQYKQEIGVAELSCGAVFRATAPRTLVGA